MNDQTDAELLRAYAENRTEAAFAELVRRHMDLVYSAALRMVCDAHLAKDVTQGAFVALAQNADKLAQHPVLSGWLHRTTQNIAAQTVRTDVRRRNREQEATAMNELLAGENEAAWTEIAPHLDAALGELAEADRDALLLRYFERKSAREMAQALGISDEAAQKRVNRAVERLRAVFAQRGVAIGASGLVVLISTHSVQAAPAGLAMTVTTAVAVGGTVVTTGTALTAIETIAMTTIQKVAVTTVLAVAAGALIYEARQISTLREQNTAFQRQITDLQGQNLALQQARDAASQRQANLIEEVAGLKKGQDQSEMQRLRGEVGNLKRDKDALGKQSALNKLTADPASRKLMRDQQKMGMKMIYSDLAKSLKLDEEATGKLDDLLADHIMDGIDLVTQTLQDKNNRTEIDQIFTAADKEMESKVQALLGDEGLKQYKEYSDDILANITASQFEDNFTGTKEEKVAKKDQFAKILQEETRNALAAAGLPADYQTVPSLNLGNIASESRGEQSLKLLDDIYARAVARSEFMSEDELKKFSDFRAKAQENNRTILLMNRNMMAPLAQ